MKTKKINKIASGGDKCHEDNRREHYDREKIGE